MTLAPFDANAVPLSPGIRLLEASAGTGKTFALAHLVLRMVAEGGVSLRRLLVVSAAEVRLCVHCRSRDLCCCPCQS